MVRSRALIVLCILSICRPVSENLGVNVLLRSNPGPRLDARLLIFAPLIHKQPQSVFNNGSQDMSEFLKQRDNAESGLPRTLPWLAEARGADASAAPCVPDTDLELEWIHGYSAQVTCSNCALLIL